VGDYAVPEGARRGLPQLELWGVPVPISSLGRSPRMRLWVNCENILGVTIKLIAKSRIDGHLLRGSKTDEENVEQILKRGGGK